MPTDDAIKAKIAPQPAAQPHPYAKNIAILAVIVLILGVYHIVSAVLVSKDTINFVTYAKTFTENPAPTIRSNDQHPGFPAMIFLTHQAVKTFSTDPVWSWLYSAQITALVFRLLSIIPLYFLARMLVGPKLCFWSMFVLLLSPDLTKYGSDGLSDWPHLFFLSSALLAMIYAAQKKKLWPWPLVGLLTGLGYLIRPECAQIIIYAGLFLALSFVWKTWSIGFLKTIAAGLLVLVFFFACAIPYMHFKGAIFPKKKVLQFESTQTTPDQPQNLAAAPGCVSMQAYKAGINFAAIGNTSWKIAENICQTLLWFYAFPLIFALFKYFIYPEKYDPKRVILLLMILLNIALLSWLYNSYHYMDRRHTIILAVLGAILVPLGIEMWAHSFEKIFTPNAHLMKKENRGHFWFFLLLVVGFCIYLPNLYTPIHNDKQALRSASDWLIENTTPSDSIALCPDLDGRIGFYAQRKTFDCEKTKIPPTTDYIIDRITPDADHKLQNTLLASWPYKYNTHVVIYTPDALIK